MSDIYVFSSNEEDNDYTTMGLAGALTPTKCTFKEEANGESTVTLSHPIDEYGRHTYLQRGNILVVPVPVRTTPEIDDETNHCVTTVWLYKIKPSNQLTSKSQRTLYKKAKGGKKKKVLAAETELYVVWDSNKDDERVKVKVKKTGLTGFISKDSLILIDAPNGTAIPDNSHAIEEIASPWTITDQYFRIYETTAKLDSIEVTARHISYDLLYNMTDYENKNEAKLGDVLKGILSKCYSSDHGFTAHTNVDNQRAGTLCRGKNPIDAFLDPEEGVCKRFNVSLVRDNFDLYFLHDPGINRGVRIQYSKNMTGIDFTSGEDEVATRIVPVGETKKGDPLYLDSNLSKRYIDSPYINAYPFPHVYELKCENCKIGEEDSNGGKVTEARAKARMRQQAQDLLATHCDEPKIEMKVEFVNLGDTEDYAQFKNLENLFLFDYVVVQHPTLCWRDVDGIVKPIDVTARIVSIEWDCILDRMNSVEIGQVGKSLANNGVTSWQIPSGVNGAKIAYQTLGSAALAPDIIAAEHIQSETINSTHLNASDIAAFVINAVTAHFQSLEADTIKTDELIAEVAKIVNLAASHINANDISTDTLAAALVNATVLSAGTGYFNKATVQHLVSSAMNLEYGVGEDVFIQNLKVAYAQMVSAAIGNLCIKASDGNYYSIDVGSNGNVTATPTTVSEDEITAGQTSNGRVILNTDILADNLSTSNLLATYALVNKIDATRIDVDQLFARDAFIDMLHTSLIQSDDFISFLVGTVDEEVEDGIDDIKIGTRNYLRNSRTMFLDGVYGFDLNAPLIAVCDAFECNEAVCG